MLFVLLLLPTCLAIPPIWRVSPNNLAPTDPYQWWRYRPIEVISVENRCHPKSCYVHCRFRLLGGGRCTLGGCLCYVGSIDPTSGAPNPYLFKEDYIWNELDNEEQIQISHALRDKRPFIIDSSEIPEPEESQEKKEEEKGKEEPDFEEEDYNNSYMYSDDDANNNNNNNDNNNNSNNINEDDGDDEDPGFDDDDLGFKEDNLGFDEYNFDNLGFGDDDF